MTLLTQSRRLLMAVVAAVSVTQGLGAQADVGDLRTVPVPMPDNLDRFIKDRDAAIALGKALFWDMQVGANNRYACATCHHKAGTDSRVNFRSLHPGANGRIDVNGPSLTLADFPFDLNNDDIVGSIGLPPHAFLGVDAEGNETCELLGGDPQGNQVTGMASPASVNAVFSELQFWDGRAQSTFNGVDIHGTNHDAASYPTVYEINDDGQVIGTNIAITNASLASQAVGPANNPVEMSCAGRDWGHLAQKLLPRKPLALQKVSTNDSVLGGYVDSTGAFAGMTYSNMVYEAFNDRYVSSLPAADTGWTVEEANFSLYWGLALNLYQALLVSDDSPWDRYIRGDSSAVSAAAIRGHEVFVGDGECDRCHRGAETSNAAVTNGGGGRAFANIGLRPIAESEGLRRGEHKSVGMRNLELSNPYMWNGSRITLRQAVRFYNLGGDFRGGRNELRVLGLNDQQERDLVAFMLALTDDRVRCDRGVFDHPSLELDFGESLPAVGSDGLEQCWRPALDDGSVEDFHYQLSFADANEDPVADVTVPAVISQAPVVPADDTVEQQQVVQAEVDNNADVARAERRAARAERRAAKKAEKRQRRRSERDAEDDDD